MLPSENRPKFQAMGIGDAMVDLYTYAAELPPVGGNIWSSAVTMNPGGTTANVAANIAKLGIRSVFIGCLGSDPYGRYTIDEFVKAHVDTSGIVLRRDAYTGIVLAIINQSGERTFIACARGAAHSFLSEEYVSKIDFSQTQIVHSSGVCLVEEPSRQALLMALGAARKKEKVIFFDPNLRLEGNLFPDTLQQAEWKAIELSNVVLLGEEELNLLCDTRIMQDGVNQLLDLGVDLVIVKQGAEGATAYWKDGTDHFPTFRVNVVSTAGAGDSFDAGFMAARLRNADIHDSLVYANAVAAIKVTHQNARAVPTHGEVLAFLAERNQYIEIDQ